jgi:hypothetical protein
MMNAHDAYEVPGQSLYDQFIPEDYYPFDVTVIPDDEENSGSLVDPKAAFSVLMERIGNILHFNPK